MSQTALAFAGSYAALLLLAFVRHPVYGLFAYLLAFYNHPPSRWWGGELPDLRWSLLAGAITLVATVVHGGPGTRRAPLPSTPAKLIAAYAAWMGLQTLFAVDPEGGVEGAILFAKYVLLIVLMVRTLDSRERVEQFIWAHVAGCFVFSWIAWRDPRMQHGRLEAVGGPGVDDSNTLAIHCVTGLVCAGFLLFSRRWIARGAALGATAFIMNTIVLCGSRGAFVALAASGAVANAFAPPGRRRTVAGLSIAALALLAAVGHEQFWERMRTIRTYEEDTSAISRLALVRPTVEMFRDHPLGVGHEGFRKLSGRYCPPEILDRDGTRSPHTTVLAVLAEQGVPGLAIYGALLWTTLASLVRLRFRGPAATDPDLGRYVAMIACGLAAFAVAGITSSYLKAEAQIWLIGLLAVVEAIAAEERAAGPAPAPPARGRRLAGTRRAA